jgi:hypothetical protein
MYAHMLEMQERNNSLEKTVNQQASLLHQQNQQRNTSRPVYFDPSIPSAALEDGADDDDAYSSSDGFEEESGSDSDDTGEDSSEKEGCGGSENDAGDASKQDGAGDSSKQHVRVDTTDALAGAAREALRIDPCAGDAAANAVLLQRLLKSCIRRMVAQEELLQTALSAAQPAERHVAPSDNQGDASRMRQAVVAAVQIAQSFIHDNAMIQAEAAERDAQVTFHPFAPHTS